ncbi:MULTISPECIES: NAD(P)H-dependent flavin oxidoreductase [Nitratireductor]|uniref:NAD(P)H-dependent flavin oxidoreductase n=1 Tax=Nitratireductor TaxID=245876 RepID=UPI000D0D7D67|nr:MULTISPECIES: nitronate monooxygenase family protein [Nitratireductor]PSM15860.1 2-nitropropane dioxygenase [Nitratireductor sp. StC3]
MWSDNRVLELIGIEVPILQAPMAGSSGAELAIAVSTAGGLGSLPCALLGPERIRAEYGAFRQQTDRPVNLNFFCHATPAPDAAREAGWRARLAAYYAELDLDPDQVPPGGGRVPFDEAGCALVEECRPQVVSFHFGLPEPALVERVKKTGARIIASATTVAEARWLEGRGCDAIIAQGAEAGGHRGLFLTDDVAAQPGTMALVPQVVDAVAVPVIAAGGIADPRGVAAAFMLGAAAVQIGTGYLQCPEALTAPGHRAALAAARDDETVLTNVFTGRPARGLVNRIVREVGPLSAEAPAFPLASAAVGPLRARAEKAGSRDFSPLWAGQAAALGRVMPAGELTRWLGAAAQALLAQGARAR